MATAAAELFVRIGADIKGLTSGFGAAAQAADGLGKPVNTAAGHYIDANGRMRDANGRFVASANQATGAAGNLAGGLTGLKTAAAGVGLAAIATGITMVGQRAVNLAAELEQAKIGFTTMLGGAKQADTFLRDLTQFAATTPFELRGLVDSSKRLLAFGFDAKGVIPIMTAVGNAVAGLGGGKEVLDGVTTALGQMAAKGKVSAEEMNQLAERGIPAWKMLADGIGVSIPQAMKMAEKGAIDANKAIVSIINGMNEKFPDMMAKQSQSFSGAMSNLQDSADIALTKIGQKLMETLRLTDVIKALSMGISNLTDAFTKGGLIAAMDRAFGPAAKAAIVGFGAVVVASATPAIVALGGALLTAAASAAPMIAAGLAIAAAAYPIIKNWEGVKVTTIAYFNTAATYAAAWYNRAARVFSDFAAVAADAFRYVSDWIRDTFGVDIAAKLGVGVAKAGGYFKGFKQMAVEGLGAIGGSVTSVANTIVGDFTQAFQGGSAAVRASMGKVTAEILGLKAAAQQATGAATGKAKALKKVETEARKAEAAFDRLTKVNQQAYDRFEAMAMSLGKLGAALREVDAQAAEQGRSFDVAGARAKAYKENVAAIESAFGKFSAQAVNARAEMERFSAASVNGGAATAQAFGVIDQASTALTNQAFAAQALGKEWDATAEGIKSAEGVLVSLIDKGLRPGNQAYDEAAKKLADVKAALKAKQAGLIEIADSMGNVFSAINGLLNNLSTLAESLGVTGVAAAIKFAQAGIQIAQALAQIPAAIAAVGNALTALSALFVTNPILAAVLAIVGVVAIAGTAMYQWWQSTQEEARKTAEEMRKVEEEAKRVQEGIQNSLASAFRQAGKDFLNNVAEWGDNLRAGLRQNIIDGIMEATISGEMMKNLASLREAVIKNSGDPASEGFKKAVEAFKVGMEAEMERLKPVWEAMGVVINKVLPDARQKVAEGKDAIEKASATARSTVDQGSKAAVERYLRAQMDALTNLRNRGIGPGTYEYEVTADQARAAARQLQNMATGGLVTGPTMARLGEGGRNEAVLPLNENVYRQIGQGIASARGGGGGAQVVVQYYGNGKWTREDAQGLGRLMVSELRAMGVRA